MNVENGKRSKKELELLGFHVDVDFDYDFNVYVYVSNTYLSFDSKLVIQSFNVVHVNIKIIRQNASSTHNQKKNGKSIKKREKMKDRKTER